MDIKESEFQPYVGPRPFEDKELDHRRFFGRDREAVELLSLVTAHAAVLLYAQSGAGKTSLINAKLIALLKAQGFEVLPAARVHGAPRSARAPRNAYVQSVLACWANASDGSVPDAPSISAYLKRRPRPQNEEGQPVPRVIIFDQFEELFSTSAERSSDRADFVAEIRDALEGSPTLLQPESVLNPPALVELLNQPGHPAADFLRQRLQIESFDAHLNDKWPSVPVRQALAYELNRIIQNAVLHRGATGPQPPVDPALLRRLLDEQARNLPRVNRLLLEAMFPGQFAATTDGDPLLRAIFVIREDFLAELDPYAHLVPEKLRIRFRLERLRRPAALDAVRNPVERFTRRRFAAGVAEQLVTELMRTDIDSPDGRRLSVIEEFVEPVQLQVVCDRLWRELPSGSLEITEHELKALGNVDQALADFYEGCIRDVAAATGVNEPVLRRWFEEHLITAAGTRGTVFRGETHTAGVQNAVVDRFERLHLIRREIQRGGSWYELTHDRFVGPVLESNRRWRIPRASASQLGQRLKAQAASWAQSGHSGRNLFEGVELLEAERWLNSRDADEIGIGEETRAFIQASRSAVDDRAEAQKIARLRSRSAVLVVIVLFMVGVSAVAVRQKMRADRERKNVARMGKVADVQRKLAVEAKQDAQRARNEAEKDRDRALESRKLASEKQQLAEDAAKAATAASARADAARRMARSRELASLARQRIQDDPQLGVSLALEAVEMADTVQAREALHLSLAASHQMGVLAGHSQAVNAALFTPDGKYILTSSEDGTARLWNTRSPSIPVAILTGHKAGIHSVVVDKRGTRVATEAADGTSRVWEIPSGRPLFMLPDASGPVATVALSPDGRFVATETLAAAANDRVAQSGAVLVWNITRAVGNGDKAHDLKAESDAVRLTGPAGAITALEFTPDGRFLAAGSRDATVRIWDLATAKSVSVFKAASEVTGVHFSPDGRVLMAISNPAISNPDIPCSRERQAGTPVAKRDGLVSLWDVPSGTELGRLIGHTDAINSAMFSPDGLRVVTSSCDKTAREWDARTFERLLVLNGHTDGVARAVFSGDGKAIVTAGLDGTARIWSVGSGTELQLIQGHGGQEINDARFSPDDRMILTAGRDRTARLWDAAASGWVSELSSRRGDLSAAQWSPDGRYAVLAVRPRPAAPASSLPAGVRESQLQLWDSSTGARVVEFRGAPPMIDSVSFSADGQYFATTNAGHSAHVWNVDKTDPVAELRGHKETIYETSFSPDGKLVATASADDTAGVWDTSTGRRVATLRHDGEVNTVRFSANGEYLVTASDDRTACVWRAGSWAKVATIAVHGSSVLAAQFSPDGRERVLTVGIDGIAAVSEASTGRLLFPPLKPADATVTSAAFSPNGKLMVTADSARAVRIWSADTGRELVPPLVGHAGQITQLNFSADSQRVVTTSADNTVRIWDTGSGRELKVLRGHLRVVVAGQFAADGKSLMTASNDGTARVWDAVTGTNLLTLRPDADVFLAAALSPRTGRIVLASSLSERARLARDLNDEPSGESVVEVFNAETGAVVSSFPQREPVQGAAFSHDGRLVVTANQKTASGSGGTARLLGFDANDPTPLRSVRLLEAPGSSILSAAFSHDGKLVATGSEDKTARLWKASGQLLFELRDRATPISGPIKGVIFSRDDKSLLTFGGDDQFPRLWTTETGQLAFKLTGHTGPITYAEFSPDGRQIVTASLDGTALVWSVSSGRRLFSLGEFQSGDVVYQARFSPDGKRLVTASADNTADVWDAETGRLMFVLRGHRGKVNAATFSPDGKWILTVSDDTTAQIWEADTGARVFTFRGHRGPVLRGEFSADGQRVLTTGRSDSAMIFSCGLCRPLSELVSVAQRRGRPLTTEEKGTYLDEDRAPKVSQLARAR